MCLSQLILFITKSIYNNLCNSVINIALLAFEQIKKRFFAYINIAQAFDKKHINKTFNNFKYSFLCRYALRERLLYYKNNYRDSNPRINVFFCFRFCFNCFVCFFNSYRFCRFHYFVYFICFYRHRFSLVCFRRCYYYDNLYFYLFFSFST